MGTIEAKLLHLQGTKAAIKTAIEAKGVTVPVGTNFMGYAGKISSITTGGSPTADPYVRPSTWLDLPDNVAGVEKVSILYALFDTSSNMVAFTCQDDYIVDWGDGTSDNYTSGTKALHTYDFNTGGGILVEGESYKQVIITITPQIDKHLTYVNLNQTHPTLNNVTVTSPSTSGIQDIRINSSYLNSLYIGSSSNSELFVNYVMGLLEQCIIGEVGISLVTAGYLFVNCYTLQNVVFNFNTEQITNWGNTFNKCYKLQKAPSIQFPATSVTTNSMFSECYTLKEVPDMTFNSTSIGNMFNNCRLLQSVNITFTNTAYLTTSSMFQNCYSLVEVDLTFTNTGVLQGCVSMFSGCYALVNAPDIPYVSATNLSSMYSNCYALQNIPDIELSSSCLAIANIFQNCYALQKAPNIIGVTTGIKSISGLFINCLSLVDVPDYNFQSVTNMNSIFGGCSSLVSIPNITTDTIISNSSIVSSCYSLSKLTLPLTQSFSIINAKMSTGALNEMYSILPTITGTSQTVTVTGNYGATNTPVVSLTKSFNEGSKIVAMTDTTNLSVGMFVAGSGTTLTTGKSCTFTDSGNLVTSTGHSLIDGDIVSFNTLNGPTGIAVKTIYYVANATTNTFQLSLTQGGSVIGLVAGAGSNGIYNSPAFITAITTNVSIELSLPMVSTGTMSLAFRSNDHKTYLAIMKGWTVTG